MIFTHLNISIMDNQSIERDQTSINTNVKDLHTMRQFRVPNRISESKEPSSSCNFIVAVCADKNSKKRRRMEDGHTYKYDFTCPGQGFFAVYDGHAGPAAAKWCESNLHEILEKQIKQNILVSDPQKRYSIQDILCSTFEEADSQIAQCKDIYSGTTAVVALYKPISTEHNMANLYVANAGDARLVLSHLGKAIRLTYDHKATDEHEMDRINKSGGVVHNERVNGILAITRALGDGELKDLIISKPYTTKINITKDDDLIILACDGLWDVCNDQEAIDLIQPFKENPLKASEFLVDYAIEHGSTDNITVMVVKFNH